MSAGRHTFRLNDLKRALLTAKALGIAVDVEIQRDPDRMIIRTKDGEKAVSDAREWQDEITKLKAKPKPKAKRR